MKKTFKDFLTEIDWDELGDPSKMSPEERRDAMHIASSQPTSEVQPRRSDADRMRAAAKKLKGKATSYDDGPAVNDVKVVVERLHKFANDLDTLASELEMMDGVGHVIRDMDEMREKITTEAKRLEKVWTHLAVGGKPYRTR